MKKYLCAFVVLLAMFITLTIPAYAADDTIIPQSSIEVIYFQNGDYIITETEEALLSRSTTKTGSKTSSYYSSSDELLWKVKLTGTFEYTYGVSASCTNASHQIIIYDNNWNTRSATSYYSENKSFADVTLNQKLLGIVIRQHNVNLTLTCDKYGTLS